MKVIDSILTFLRDRREITKERKGQISGYIRKIANCCSDFTESCRKLNLPLGEENFSAQVQNLQHQVDLVDNYLASLDAVLQGRVRSETLDDVAVTLSRIVTLEIPVVNMGRIGNMRHHKFIEQRFEGSWKNHLPFGIVFWPPNVVREYGWPRMEVHGIRVVDNFSERALSEVRKKKSMKPTDVRYAFPQEKDFLDCGINLPKDSDLPSPDQFLAGLSRLHAKLVVLADAIEAGAEL